MHQLKITKLPTNQRSLNKFKPMDNCATSGNIALVQFDLVACEEIVRGKLPGARADCSKVVQTTKSLAAQEKYRGINKNDWLD